MTNFPAGQLVIREFELMTDAHQTAGELAEKALQAKLDLRLVEVSATAGGAWLCAWLPSESKHDTEILAHALHLQVVDVDPTVMNAFLSLAPKPSPDLTQISIFESETIADVFRSASTYVRAGAELIELRIKRAGPKRGAYCFMASREKDLNVSAPAPATALKVVGDYRRFFF